MKRVTLRVTVHDLEADQLINGGTRLDPMFHGPFEVLGVEEFTKPVGFRTFDEAGKEIETAWFDEGSEALAAANQALRAGATVKLVTREVVPA